MKKIVALISLYVWTLLPGLGQTTPGSLFLGPDFHFNNRESKGPDDEMHQSTGEFIVSLQAGRFIHNNLVLGLDFAHSRHENTQSNYANPNFTYYHSKSRYYGLGPFIRKYIPLADKLFFYGQANTQFNVGRHKQETRTDTPQSLNTDHNSRGLSAGLAAGFTYFLTPKIGLDLSNSLVAYNYSKIRHQDERTHHLALGLNLSSLSYGVRFYFAR